MYSIDSVFLENSDWYFGKWAGVVYPYEAVLPLESEEATMCFFFVYRRGQMQHIILYLRRDTWHVPYHWTSRNLSLVESPWIFVWFISHPLTCKCLANNSRVVATSCILGLSSIISWMCNGLIWYLVQGNGYQDPCKLNCSWTPRAGELIYPWSWTEKVHCCTC